MNFTIKPINRLCFGLLLVSLLTGCSVHRQPDFSKQPVTVVPLVARYTDADKDSAPDFVPVFFQKVKPVHEPLSRYGNPGSYRVRGQTYKVLTSSKGYKARGQASWYGTKFHRQRTSSGEPYDMYAMTAAHKTLPLPSYVKVKNLTNGRETIVRVNDRGPFHANRIIDLSYAAATKLGMLPRGTAQVEVVAITPADAKRAASANYFVQAGAFKSSHFAYALKNKIKNDSTVPVGVEKYKNQYLVKAGPFTSRFSAWKYKQQLDKQGIHGAFSVLQ